MWILVAKNQCCVFHPKVFTYTLRPQEVVGESRMDAQLPLLRESLKFQRFLMEAWGRRFDDFGYVKCESRFRFVHVFGKQSPNGLASLAT